MSTARARLDPGLRHRLLALLAALAAAVLTATELATPLDDGWHAAMAARQPPPSGTPVLVLGVDAASLKALGPWPWHRDRFAEALRRLQAAGAGTVALDLPLEAADTRSPEADAALARMLPGSGTVLGVRLTEGSSGRLHAWLPAPEFAETARLGHVWLTPDRDGRIRHHWPMQASDDGMHWNSLAAALYRPAAAASPLARWRIPPPDRHAPAYRSFHELLAGKLGEADLRGRRVLIGLASPQLAMAVPGPAGSAPLFPVQHQALALSAWLRGTAARPLGMTWQALLAFLLAGAGVHAGLGGPGRTHAARMPLAITAAMLATLSISAALLTRQWWFAPSASLVVLAVALLGHAASRARQRLRTHRPVPGVVSWRRMRTAVRSGPAHVLLRVELAPMADARTPHAAHRHLAQLLQARARRPGDLVASSGPGRYALFLPLTGSEAAIRLADSLRDDARDAGIAVHCEISTCDAGRCTCLEHARASDPPPPRVDDRR